MKILVVGGAGYIGSHMVKRLVERGDDVIIVDNFSTGSRSAVKGALLVEADISNRPVLDSVLQHHNPHAIFHFASLSQVGESMTDPSKYYKNNTISTLSLFDAMIDSGIKKIIFSSTASVYGNPIYTPIDENHPKEPISPYGNSKLMIEKILNDYKIAYGVQSVCLRYFNVSGADPDSKLGEQRNSESHLIPLLLQVASGRREFITIYGNNYDTPDGTCIRDYVHVNDIIDANLLSLEYILSGKRSACYNIGNGTGFSIGDVISTAEHVVGRKIPVRYAERRAGDPPRLIADATRAHKELGWIPKRTDIETIIRDAWNWEKKRS